MDNTVEKLEFVTSYTLKEDTETDLKRIFSFKDEKDSGNHKCSNDVMKESNDQSNKKGGPHTKDDSDAEDNIPTSEEKEACASVSKANRTTKG